MSKLKPGGPDRKGEGPGDGEGSLRMVTSQVLTPGSAPTRPTVVATGHTYIVQSKQPSGHHHEIKNFAKLARSIAPAPSQPVQGLSGRTVHTSQPNIPSIISPSLAHVSAENLVSLNLVATTTSSGSQGTAPVHQTIPVPLLPPQQASVLQLTASVPAMQIPAQTLSTVTNPTVLAQPQPPPQGNTHTPSTLPINILRGAAISGTNPAGAGGAGNPPTPLQTFTPAGFPSHLPRGTTTLSVPKSATTLRPGATPGLQIPNAGLTAAGINPHSLSLARLSIPQAIKTSSTPQGTARSPSPAVSGQPTPQVQPHDLSRTNFAMHGSISPVSSTGTLIPHPMQIRSRLSSDVLAHNRNQTPGESDLVRQTLPFGAKLNPSPGPQAKIVNSQSAGQHIAPIKSVNLAVSNPVMINSINASLLTTANTIASTSTPVSMVTAQRPVPISGLSVSSASIIAAHSLTLPSPSTSLSSSSSSLSSFSSAGPMAASNQGQQTPSLTSSAPTSTLLSGYSLSAESTAISTMAGGTAGGPGAAPGAPSQALPMRPEVVSLPVSQAVVSATPGAIIIPPEFQTRPSGGGSVIPISSMGAGGAAGSIVSSHPDNRGSMVNSKGGGAMWLQQYVYHQSPMVSQSAASASPGLIVPGPGSGITGTAGTTGPSGPSTPHPFQSAQNKGPTMAANQLAHAMSVASSSNIRFNSGMMVVDHMRQQQQQLPLHSAFTSNASTTSCSADKTILTPHELVFSAGRTQASSALHYSSTIGVQSQHTAAMSTGLSAVPVSNPSSSPRPSILRKRNSEAAGVVIRKPPNFNLTPDSNRCHSPPRLDPTASMCVSSPKTPSKNFSPASENSQSSTDTALSSNDAHTPTQNHQDKGKGDGDDCLENGPASSLSAVNNIPASPAASHTGSLSEASPRKRARKQLLHANEELKDRISSSDEEMEVSPKHRHRDKDREDTLCKDKTDSKFDERRGEYRDKDGVRWVFEKPRPNFVLIHPDNINNKTRNNHFSRYSDVKPKEERRPTVNELCNQRGIGQKVNGWKLYFTASQLEELMDVEKDLQGQFADVQAALSCLPVSRIAHDEAGKIHEMSQANIQRCQLIQSQLTEARASMIKTLEHQPRIQEILGKHTSKRPIKKKERT